MEVRIPAVDNNYVPFGVYEDLEPIIATNMFFPIYITGPTGNGKSTTVEQLCAKYNRGMIRVNLNSQSDEEQLIGTKTLVNGNIEIVYGPVLKAMLDGQVLLLDEIDAANPNTILAIQGICEGKPYYFKLDDVWITPAKGFNIIATGNTKGKGSDDGQYIGTNVLNEAFLERFGLMLEQPYPTKTIETEILNKQLENLGKPNKKFTKLLTTWSSIVRKTYDEGGVSSNISTRRLIHIIRAYVIYGDQDKAIKLALNRFDIQTQDSFYDLYVKLIDKTLENSTSDK